MYFKILTGSVFAASLAIIPAERVEADAGDFIAGAIIGGIVGANAKKQRRTTRSTKRRTTKRSTRARLPSTQEGKSIQASLNYFGFDAGTVDGQLGRKTKNAVSQYQAYLGYPVTGQLSQFEKNLLTSSYNRAQAGGYAVQQQVASNVDGTRGLLKTYRAEMAGGTADGTVVASLQQPVIQQPVIQQPAVIAPQVVAPQAVATLGGATALAAAVAPATGTALPNFLGAGTQASLASHCNQVSLITNTNGGFVSLASMTDPNAALNEQFCLARTYAIAKSEELTSRIQGFTPDQIAAQCQGFGPAMKDKVASLSLKPRDAVVQDVASFVQTTGMSPAQLQGTAKICLGVGYRTDNMDVAVGSALILYTLGEAVYGELMGHHLSQGFGPQRRADMAQSWYEAGLTAAESGQAVFVPGQPERTELIRQAAFRANGGIVQQALPTPQPASGSALPTFTISE